MACCGDASLWAKFGLICMILAFGLQSAAFLSNYWMIHNTVRDRIDTRVGLLWTTNCTPACSTFTTPSTYDSLYFTLTKAFEGTATGLFFIIAVIYAFYTLSDRSRTRLVAAVTITLLVIAEMFPVAGIVFWTLQINYPYFLAWSPGLSMIATGLALLSLLSLIPDLKEYPYYSKSTVNPSDNESKHLVKKKKPPTQKNIKNETGKDLTQKKQVNDQNSSDDYMDYRIDRHALNMVTPSQPPRYSFMKTKL